MKRRNLLQVLLGAATAAAPGGGVERPANFDASVDLAKRDWRPTFLDEHQNETLIVLSDLILPATDTPGAKEALVNRFLDHLMASEREAVQRDFLSHLAYVEGESMRQYKAAFLHLPKNQQIELLTFLAYPHSLARWGEPVVETHGHNHFQQLKRWISSAYYNSEVGLRELGWDGSFPHGEPTGCGEQNPPTHHHASLVALHPPKA